jgi:hypothetical protein
MAEDEMDSADPPDHLSETVEFLNGGPLATRP